VSLSKRAPVSRSEPETSVHSSNDSFRGLEASVFISSDDYLEEQFSPSLGKGDISQLIQNKQIKNSI